MSISQKKKRLKTCKNPTCTNKFTPYYTTTQEVCSQKCAIELGKIRKEKKDKKENTQAKKDLLSTDAYRAKVVQPIINEIARLIDYGQACVPTGTFKGKMNGGHYIAVGANRTIALNLHNIHQQSFSSNHHKGGDNLKYRLGLIKIYGQDYADAIQALHQTQPIKLTKERLKEIEKTASQIRNGLKKNPVILSPEDRIEMREIINQQIGIYEPLNYKQ